ncbi:MAG TPA: hypothetical protein VJO53_12325 [Candidatus Acidoferrales bacterium]|nr:hypothetical protein [Candidatus Acidoferrales bacterium]
MIRQNQTREHGGATLKLVVVLVIFAAMAFAAFKIIPVYLDNYQFQDAVETESRFALTGFPKKSIEDIRDDVFRKAQELDIPAKRDDIRVVVSSGSVDIALDYSVPVDLKVYQFTMQFHTHADNHTI